MSWVRKQKSSMEQLSPLTPEESQKLKAEGKEIEALCEVLEEQGGVDLITSAIISAMQIDWGMEWRYGFHPGLGTEYIEMRPVIMDITPMTGTEEDGRPVQSLAYLEQLDLLELTEKLKPMLYDLSFGYWRSRGGREYDEPHFAIEGKMAVADKRCPLTVEVYFEQPFEDTEVRALPCDVEDDLIALWRSMQGQRVQNHRVK
jgi:hypothetical protein